MKKIKHNNYTLPNVGACVQGVKEEDKQEFLRLLGKAGGFSHGSGKFGGMYNHYGVPTINNKESKYWYDSMLTNNQIYFHVLPILEAITWLKIGVGEITKENWVVDIVKEKDHPRMGEFKSVYCKIAKQTLEYTSTYYGFINKLPCNYSGCLRQYEEEIENNPIISLDQFFAYFYEEQESTDRQPVKGDLVEVSRNGKHWINSTLRWYSGAQNLIGEYITELNGDLYAWKYIRLPKPEPTPRELAEKKAREWLKSKGYDYSVPAILEPMTEYILKTEFN